MKIKVALVRGKFLNRYEMQTFEYLYPEFDITAFGSKTSFHDSFQFPVKNLLSPMDLPESRLKMPILNRLFTDAHHLFGLEDELNGFDIVHSAETYYRYTQQILNAKDKGFVKKVVVTVLDNIPHNNEGIRGRKEFKKRTREKADILIALTEKTKKSLIVEGADPEKILVIGSGIDTNRFQPKPNNASSLLRILFVGRFEKYKGVFEILEAATNLVNDYKNIEFVFVGAGSEENEMYKFEKKYGLDKFVTHKSIPYEKIHEIYQSADIFIAPSKDIKTWQEQYGYMLLEAQASGLPIITTDAGSIPEVVGDAAIIVEQNDVQELTQQLKKLIENKKLRNEYGRKARIRAETVHDSRIIAGKLKDLYLSII